MESYVLDRDDLELYGVEVEVAFVDRLRGMVKFEGMEALIETMHDDVRRARETSWRDATADRHRASRRGSSRTACPTSSPIERAACAEAWLAAALLLALGLVGRAARGPGVASLARLAARATRRPAVSLCVTVLLAVAPVYAATRPARAADRSGGRCAQTLASLGFLFPLASRALPLLLLFVTFLFVNTEVWQITSSLAAACCGSAAAAASAGAWFLLVRLPEEVDRRRRRGGRRLRRAACAGTPLSRRPRGRETRRRPAGHAQVAGFERWQPHPGAAGHPDRPGAAARR